MIVTLEIVRYPRFMGWAGFLSMAVFRFPLWLQHRSHFWKLMGCGRNGTFDKTPDWRQWALLQVYKDGASIATPGFIENWWRFFGAEKWRLTLQPIEGHGTWDGKKAMGDLPKQGDYEGLIAVLTRATIRPSQLSAFWKHVDGVAEQMAAADSFITSVGIGEVPFIKQATFSIWKSKTAMKAFAYGMQQHKTVIQKTRKENWYSEDMFVRFTIISSTGSIHGKNPLAEML